MNKWIPWIITGVVIILVGSFLSILLPSRLREKDLKNNGKETVARVLSVAQTGLYLNKLPQLLLRIVYHDGSKFRFATKTGGAADKKSAAMLSPAFTVFVLTQFLIIGIVFLFAAYYSPGKLITYLPMGKEGNQKILLIHEIGSYWFENLMLSTFDSRTGEQLQKIRMNEGLLQGTAMR